MKNPFIIEIPADNFFPIRYAVQRADGKQTHPHLDRGYCEYLIAKFEDDGRKHWYRVVSREKKGKPYKLICTLGGTCQSDAEHRAWMRCLINYMAPDYDPLLRVIHESEWQQIEVRQHLKAVGIKGGAK